MKIYDEFIASLRADELIDVCETLRYEIMHHAQIEIKKKFNLPFFYGKTWICYLNGIKKKKEIVSIELCFVRGRELLSKELLDFKQRTMIGGLTFKNISEIDLGVLRLLLQEAIELDETKPYTFIKKKKNA